MHERAVPSELGVETFPLKHENFSAATLSYLWIRVFIAANDPNHKLCHCRYEKCSAPYFMELTLCPRAQVQRAQSQLFFVSACDQSETEAIQNKLLLRKIYDFINFTGNHDV